MAVVMRKGYNLPPGSWTQFTPLLLNLIVPDPHGLYGSVVAAILACKPAPGAQRTRILTMPDTH